MRVEFNEVDSFCGIPILVNMLCHCDKGRGEKNNKT